MQLMPFPWKSLELVSAHACRVASSARRALLSGGAPTEIGAALTSLLGADVEIVLNEVVAPPRQQTKLGDVLGLQTHDGKYGVQLYAEPQLTDVLLSRLLGRPAGLARPRVQADEVLSGALAALAIEAARRAGVLLTPGPILPARSLTFEARLTLLVDGRAYAAALHVSAPALPPRDDGRALASLGQLPIEVPLVVAHAALDPGASAALALGDALLFGDALTLRADGSGSGWLAPASGERGLRVELLTGGQMRYVGSVHSLPHSVDSPSDEASSTMQDANNGDASEADANNEELEHIVLDAPLVVRVELGSVSMTAREWAVLRPGDVLETGERLGNLVSLRVAGQKVAEGELVNVDGALGVRLVRIEGEPRHKHAGSRRAATEADKA